MKQNLNKPSLHQHNWICPRPFEWVEITPSGDIFLCCPTWLNIPIGNIFNHSFTEIWNGKIATKVRTSITNQSYKYCQKEICPFLVQNPHLISTNQKSSPNLTSSPQPKILNCAFDRSCNLSCPSCRKTKFIAKGKDEQRIKYIFQYIEEQLAATIEEISVSGSGDPFGSPHTFKWLRELNVKKFPKLKHIHLHTNAQFFNPTTWGMLKHLQPYIHSMEISIDAASRPTYEHNRRGGNFDRLLKNLNYIRSLRKKNILRHVAISFVVQNNNFEEIPSFISLKKELSFDKAYISQLVNWGTFTEKEFFERAVHLHSHPNHQKLLRIMKQVSFSERSGNSTNIDLKRPQNHHYVQYVSRHRSFFHQIYTYMVKQINSL